MQRVSLNAVVEKQNICMEALRAAVFQVIFDTLQCLEFPMAKEKRCVRFV